GHSAQRHAGSAVGLVAVREPVRRCRIDGRVLVVEVLDLERRARAGGARLAADDGRDTRAGALDGSERPERATAGEALVPELPDLRGSVVAVVGDLVVHEVAAVPGRVDGIGDRLGIFVRDGRGDLVCRVGVPAPIGGADDCEVRLVTVAVQVVEVCRA